MSTFTLLPKQTRQGFFESGAQTVPAGLTTAKATILIDAADMNVPTTQLEAHVHVSADGGATWKQIGGGQWQGNTTDIPKGGGTRVWEVTIYNAAQYAGQLVKGDLNVVNSVSVGVSVTV